MSKEEKEFTTDLTALDKALGGGLTAGSIVVVRAPPHIQSEQLVQATLTANSPSVHAVTLRPAQTLRQEYRADPNPSGSAPQVESVDSSSIFSDGSAVLEGADEHNILAFDPVNELEDAGLDQYRDFLRTASQVARAEDTVIILHAFQQDSQTAARKRTLALADTVLTIDEEISGQQVGYFLYVSRNRLGDRPDDRLKFKIKDQITVDTSRDIA